MVTENHLGGGQMEKERSRVGSVRAIKITPGCDRESREEETEGLG